jgi:hypothetical protein
MPLSGVIVIAFLRFIWLKGKQPMSSRRRMLSTACAGLVLLLGWQVWLSAQPPTALQGAPASVQPAAEAGRIEFEVMQCFDAKYDGDTAGHVGRAGGLEGRRPRVALGDPVVRGNEQIGAVTGLGWSPTHGTLEVEFRPQPNVRVAVGDVVSIAIDGQARPPGR